jgi:cytochrome c
MNLWKRIGLVLLGTGLLAVLFVSGTAAQDKKGDAKKGKEVFTTNCDICHNADSTEVKVGPGLKGLYSKGPHKLSDGTEHKTHTDENITKQIVEGNAAMPPVGASLSPEELADLLAYLHTL